MKNKFYCTQCKTIFETEGYKKEWEDKIYGHCWKRLAKCPTCKAVCDEFWQKNNTSSKKNNFDFDSYVESLKNKGGGGCSPGGGCCG